MKNWKRPPLNPAVTKYVDSYWYLEKTETDRGYEHPKLNPSPDAHLILTPAGLSYRYTLNETDKAGRGSHLLLPNTRSVGLLHSDPFRIVGIKFQVGALYSLAPTANFPLLDDIIDLPSSFPSPKQSLIHLAADATSADEINGVREGLDDWLWPLLAEVHEDRHSNLTRTVLSLLEHTNAAELSPQLHCSRRTIERSFSRVTGLSLKQYDNMRKLDRLLTYLYQHQENPPNWSDIAAQFDFSDQPHLIRYLKATILATPGEYLKQRDMTIDVYGDFE